ncbi:MAG TPA: hypothetical protein VJ742_12295 [Nitrososphaera sp.]|nr:hypothetical protein [Nitrososphaera sp.]
MSLAKFRKVHSKNGSGRFVVSEGIAPSCYLLTHPGLPTLYNDIEDDRFEVVIPKGAILSVVADSNGDSRIVPANGTGSAQTWGDADTVDLETGATPSDGSGDVDTVSVPAKSTVVGCAQYDLYRPFDKGTSQGAGWITYGYVEWPLVQGVNHDLAVGDMVRSDHMGRPVKLTAAAYASDPVLRVGKVIEIEKFAQNFDDGLLSYMQLPSDPGALKDVYELTKTGPYKGKLGIRANLDVANVVGAVRVVLTP